MKIQLPALFKSTISAILTFMLLDAFAEFVILKIAGISLVPFFEQMLHVHYGIRFYTLNFVLFSFEVLLVMVFYAVLRSLFISSTKPIIITTCFFICFIGLFLMQMVNVGIYPLKPALIFGISTLISFPATVFVGAFVYDRKESHV